MCARLKMTKNANCTLDDARQKAVANVVSAIGEGLRFPRNVFTAGWRSFRFFDSDRMFSPAFAPQAKAFLEAEAGTCACMMNLDKAEARARTELSCFFIDMSTTDDAYRSFLVGGRPADASVYSVDRYGCTSDVGEWCIYCERRNEIAVIAFREDDHLSRFEPTISQLEALPITDAIRKPLSYAFDPKVLIPDWRTEIIREYTQSI